MEEKRLHGKNGGTLGKEYRKPSYRSACAAILLVVAACITVAYSLLLPEAPGTSVHKKSGLVVDASNSDQGYIMVRRQSKKTQKLRITQGDRTMSYDLNSDGDYEVFPLQLGSGKYKIEVFEKVCIAFAVEENSVMHSPQMFRSLLRVVMS